MPMIQIEIVEGRSREKKLKMIKDVTDACAEALGCPKSAVKVIVREMNPDHYAIAGVTWSEQKEPPYHL